ncbi:MAG: lysophospholipase [Bacteroidetes bacterium]|nr:MAG: lysophospholipase [Bacteroidota bacterium]
MENKKKTYLALGDSYTIGTSIAFSDNFPNQLADGIRKKIDTDVEVRIIAQNAWRTDDLQRGIKRADLEERYDLVSLLIGVNNQYQGLPLEDFENDFRNLVETAIQYSGGEKNHIFVVSIPNYGYTPFGKDKKIQTTSELKIFNTSIQVICEEQKIDFYNVTDISLEAEIKEEYRAKDDLHPSGEQYAVWVSSFLENVIEKLQ